MRLLRPSQAFQRRVHSHLQERQSNNLLRLEWLPQLTDTNRANAPVHLGEITARALHWKDAPSTHQVTVVVCFLQSARVGEEQHLGVGVDGDVELHRVLVAAQEVGHGATLWLRLRKGATVDLGARVAGGALS